MLDLRSFASRTGAPPMYSQLYALFRQRIESGEWSVNERIPALDELMAEFRVARVTLRHALGLLEAEGLIQRQQGRGTFVMGKPASKVFYRVPSTWDDLLSTVPDIEFDILEDCMAERPPLPAHPIGAVAPAYRYLRRRMMRHKVPYGIGTTYVEAQAYEAIGNVLFSKPVPMCVLNEHLAGGIASAQQTVRAAIADLRIAECLALDPGAPVLTVARSAADAKGILIYESLGIFRGDFVEVHMPLVMHR